MSGGLEQPHLFEPPPKLQLTLADRFLVPPFSVLDARQGYWRERKQQWANLGIAGEIGRGDSLTFTDKERVQNVGHYADKRAAEAAAALAAEVAGTRLASGEGRAGGLTYGTQASIIDNPADKKGGIDSAAGRGDRLLSGATPRAGYGGDYNLAAGENAWGGAGTSIFDPVLCELAYRWWAPEGGSVLDPFAGGSVRGIVAAHLGRAYTGVDLRPEQVAANEQQAATIGAAHAWPQPPRWLCGDSARVLPTLPAASYDLIFSCPPYYDLEQYSDDPADLSNAAEYAAFLLAYRDIIAASARLLRPDRFACFVVGDIRDPRTGCYRGFVADTCRAFEACGLHYYNEGILVTSVGSLPIRTSSQFPGNRKLGKTHQQILTFVKGDWRKAAAACGVVAEVALEYGGAAAPVLSTAEAIDEGEVIVGCPGCGGYIEAGLPLCTNCVLEEAGL